MITDRRPSRRSSSREYETSGRLGEIRVPRSADLTLCFESIQTARDAEDRSALSKACSQLLDRLSSFYGVAPPGLKLLGPRPHSSYEGRLASELFGDYDIEVARIRLWTRTPINKRWTSSGTILSTLCHEFMHHLDMLALGFPHTYHTVGFFERTHRLYQAALGRPYYPLAWHAPGSDGSCAIDWTETSRRKARSLGRAGSRSRGGSAGNARRRPVRRADRR